MPKNPTVLDNIVVTGRTGTAASWAITLNDKSFVVTTAALTTAAAAEYTLTMTNNEVVAGSIVLWSVGKGTSTEGWPTSAWATVTAGQVIFTVSNTHASQALNGTIKISGVILNTK